MDRHDATPRRHRPDARLKGAGVLAGAALAGALFLVGCSSPAPQATTTTSGSTTTSGPAGSSSTTPPASGIGSYMPLFPFGSAADVSTWQQAYRSSGQQPWHLDAGRTALSFAGFLGLGTVDTVTSSRTDAAGAHVSVGFHVPGDSRTLTAAVVHLVRWGSGTDAPWEAVGTDDTTFSLTTPHYGATVRSPVTAGGTISGVDESIRVRVWAPGSTSPVGVACCVPAGGDSSPWHEVVAFSASPGTVLTIVAETGGHVAGLERFTVTGVRAGSESAATAAACEGSAMLAVVKAKLPLPPPDTTTSVDVRQCGSGYARVFAVPSNIDCGKPGGSCYNDEQVFLKDTGGTWTFLENGSGIACSNPQATPADVEPACRALGLA